MSGARTSACRLQIAGHKQQPRQQCGSEGQFQGSQTPLGPNLPHWVGLGYRCWPLCAVWPKALLASLANRIQRQLPLLPVDSAFQWPLERHSGGITPCGGVVPCTWLKILMVCQSGLSTSSAYMVACDVFWKGDMSPSLPFAGQLEGQLDTHRHIRSVHFLEPYTVKVMKY